MTQESRPSKRQEWAAESGEVQRDVNKILDDVQIEIEAANLMLAALYDTDPEAAGEHAEAIVEYLDDQWPYYHDYFMVTGNWHEPSFAIHGEGLEVEHTEKEAFHPVRSNGFMVKPTIDDEGNEKPRVGMSFIVGDINYSSPFYQGEFQLLAFAEPGTISLQYLRPNNASIVSTEVGEVSDALERADSLLYLYANHPDSRFYQLSSKRQQKFLQSLIAMVEEVLPAPHAMDSIMVNEVKTSHIFFRSDELNQLVAVTRPNGKVTISGQVMGVTVGDLMHDKAGTQYTSINDFDAAGMGLSLIVKLHEVDFPIPEIMGTKEVIVPIRYLDSLTLSVL